jgi:hemolysin activation/secretion protein
MRANGNWSKAFGDGWVFAARGQAQWAPTALIAGEQFGVGGHASLRGTQERAMAGDSGVAGTLELTSPEWVPGLRWLAFWDAGWTNRQGNSGSSVPANDSASTAGLGLRYARGWLSVALDYGRVIKGSDVSQALNSAAPKSGDQKVHLQLSARY